VLFALLPLGAVCLDQRKVIRILTLDLTRFRGHRKVWNRRRSETKTKYCPRDRGRSNSSLDMRVALAGIYLLIGTVALAAVAVLLRLNELLDWNLRGSGK
jgi:hypothetical protein